MTPPHTANCSARTTNQIYDSKFGTTPYIRTAAKSAQQKRTIDGMVDRYIVLKLLEKSIPEHTKQFLASTARPTCDRKIIKIPDESTPKIDQNAKLNYI